ncbi:NADH-dependent flavin oxidoreductase [Agrilactobacillus yilanensis]|uniref:NADH-dependent flavin oxidoreductase n=1 Tax=Agrilactobacillus yilanensis TaxID=2485997 RepID=A0ABW4J4S6_9LACO|nr:NADH-dependent flavin oxidoreductase [Agrilactobacillus yilanensis]
MTKFDEPLTLKSGVTLKNRLMLSPMTTKQSFFDGTVTQDEIAYYQQRAQGLGAVLTGAANVQPIGQGWPGELGVFSDDFIPRLHELATAIQSQGAKAIVQIVHTGRRADLTTLKGLQPVGPSEIAEPQAGATVPRALSATEIETLIADFGAATRRVIAAGFDGVEIHGGNGILQQFFSPQSNQRTDDWGGSREKRYHFIDEVVKTVFATVKKYAQKPFSVGYRFVPEELWTPGLRLTDTQYLLTQLGKTPLDYVQISEMSYQRVAQAESTDFQDKSILAYLHETLAGELPLVGVGGVRTRADVAAVLENAELVAVGQQLMVDPTWAVKLAQHQDAQMVQTPFKDAIEQVSLSTPLYNYMAKGFYSK